MLTFEQFFATIQDVDCINEALELDSMRDPARPGWVFADLNSHIELGNRGDICATVGNESRSFDNTRDAALFVYLRHYVLENGMGDIIRAASQLADIDDAVRMIQDAIGQTDGGVAGMFFSDASESGWATTAPHVRASILRRYLFSEIL